MDSAGLEMALCLKCSSMDTFRRFHKHLKTVGRILSHVLSVHSFHLIFKEVSDPAIVRNPLF